MPAPGAQAPITPPSGLKDCPVAELDLLPTHPDWGGKLAAAWQPGERPARERLDYVISEIAADYEDGHDRPDVDGTSKLSPFLRWGHLSAQQLFSALQPLLEDAGAHAGAAAMLRQLAWRDFCWHLLYHYPHLSTENFRREYDAMGWAWPNEQEQTMAEWRAWTRGETGYRLVDAGMQQLWQTGWMHNRVRMVVASFLVKNLQIHWRAGEEWFWDTLVDADPASNAVNWQWVAGSGTDASPFFRVFNPELQAKKFDPQQLRRSVRAARARAVGGPEGNPCPSAAGLRGHETCPGVAAYSRACPVALRLAARRIGGGGRCGRRALLDRQTFGVTGDAAGHGGEDDAVEGHQ